MNTKRAGLIFILAITLVLVGLFARAQQSVLACGDKLIVHLVRTIDIIPQGVTTSISLAVDGKGNSYVVDGSAENPRVLKYDKHGRFLLEWGGRGSGPGQFEFWPQNPEDGPNAGFVAVDSQGYVYVSDAYNFRVQKFDSHGGFIMQFGEPGPGDGQFDPPTAGPIYVDKQDNIWVSTFPRVQKFDSQGNFMASYGSAGTGDGQFQGAGLGAIDSHGNMYIVDLFNARVQKLDANGQFLKAWGSPGTGEGQFFMPVGIVLDNSGRLYVTDNTNRVQVFTTNGRYLGQWSEPGHGYPPFIPLSGIAIDRKGDIYVDDIAIYVFRISP
jgi:tripartite motif-containing protein 71